MAWKYKYTKSTDLETEALWSVLANVPGWPSVDPGIELLEMDEDAAPGAMFLLKPRGGPRIRFVIECFDPPSIYRDRCNLLGAIMRTTHQLVRRPNGTRIDVEISVEGPLSLLWSRLVGRKHSRGIPKQTENLIQAARAAKMC